MCVGDSVLRNSGKCRRLPVVTIGAERYVCVCVPGNRRRRCQERRGVVAKLECRPSDGCRPISAGPFDGVFEVVYPLLFSKK